MYLIEIHAYPTLHIEPKYHIYLIYVSIFEVFIKIVIFYMNRFVILH